MADTDGAVQISIEFGTKEAEKELARLRSKIMKLEEGLSEKKYTKSALEKQLEEAKKAYDELYKNGNWSSEIGDIDDFTRTQEAIKQAEAEVARLQGELKKCDDAIRDGNIALDAAKNRYGEVAQEAGLVTKAEEEARKEEEKPEAEPEAEKAVEPPDPAEIEELKKQIEAARNRVGNTVMGKGWLFTDEDVEKAESDLQALLAKYNELMAQRRKYDEQAAQAEQAKAQEAQPEQTPQEAEADADEAEQEAQSKVARIRDLVKQVGGEFKFALGAVAEDGVNALKNKLAGIPGALKNAFSKGLAFAKSFGKGLLGAAKNLNVFGKLSQGLGAKLKRLGGMISRVFVFSVITKGLRAVRTAFSDMLSQNTQLEAAFAQLKGVLLTAFQPIYDVIVPALNTLIGALTRGLAVVAQFVAALFGKTASQAQESAKALNEESEALDGTGAAAEEAEGSLAGFDEINSIQTENSKGGGGGGAAGDNGATFDYAFDEMEGEIPFDSWGAAFDAFLTKILNGIPAMQSAFAAAASGINGFSEKLLATFTFPGVEEKIKALGMRLAGAFNGLVSGVKWEQMGQALGSGLNLALEFAVNFIRTFDWLNLGNSLAGYVNGIVEAIDWKDFGELLWSGFKIGLEMLAGFFLGLNMPELAKAASNIAIGFFDTAIETIGNIQWDEIGHQITEFLTNVEWGDVFARIGGFVTGMITGFTELITNVDWVDIASSILTGLLEVDWKTLFTSLGNLIGSTLTGILDLVFNGEIWSKMWELGKDILVGLLQGIWEIMKDIGGWINEHVFRPIIDWFKRLFGIHSPSTEMASLGNLLTDGLLEGIQEKIDSVRTIFSDLWESIKNVFAHIADWFREKFSAAWQAVKDVFSTGGKVFDGIKDGILDALKAIVNALITGINKIIKVPFDGLNTALGKIRKIDILGLQPFSFIKTLSVPQIPKLAQGAVIPPNREFMAVLGDQKSGTNIEAPLETIKQALTEALRESGGYGGDINVTLELDGAVLARKTVRHINDMTRQAGKPVLLY